MNGEVGQASLPAGSSVIELRGKSHSAAKPQPNLRFKVESQHIIFKQHKSIHLENLLKKEEFTV